MMKQIIIAEYNEKWTTLFEDEKTLLSSILPIHTSAIHHIGSTSVPGLAAKPVIDILIEVEDIHWLDNFDNIFELHQYTCMGEFGIAGRRYYRKGKNSRTHQIHAFTKHSDNAIRHLAFKEYLKAKPAIAKQYGQLKKRLAIQCNACMQCYTDGKNDFIKEHQRKAVAWFKSHQKS